MLEVKLIEAKDATRSENQTLNTKGKVRKDLYSVVCHDIKVDKLVRETQCISNAEHS